MAIGINKGLQVGKVVNYILANNTGVSAYVSDRIYPIIEPENVILPYICYQRTGINAVYTKDLLLEDNVSVNIVIVSKEYIESINIAQAIRTALDLCRGSYEGVTLLGTQLSNATEDVGENGFIQEITFTFKIK